MSGYGKRRGLGPLYRRGGCGREFCRADLRLRLRRDIQARQHVYGRRRSGSRSQKSKWKWDRNCRKGWRGGGGGEFVQRLEDLAEGLKDESGAYPGVQTILEELESGLWSCRMTLQAILARLEEGGITLPEELQRLASSCRAGFLRGRGGCSFPMQGESGEGKGFGAWQGWGGSSDVLLVYTDESYDSYPNIFDNAVFDVTNADKDRLIQALKNLNEGNIYESVNVDEVISYFVAHNFVLNGDSYTGSIIHNYYLHEDEGLLSMIAWDYNLAFGVWGWELWGVGDGATSCEFPIDSPVSSGELSERPYGCLDF